MGHPAPGIGARRAQLSKVSQFRPIKTTEPLGGLMLGIKVQSLGLRRPIEPPPGLPTYQRSSLDVALGGLDGGADAVQVVGDAVQDM